MDLLSCALGALCMVLVVAFGVNYKYLTPMDKIEYAFSFAGMFCMFFLTLLK